MPTLFSSIRRLFSSDHPGQREVRRQLDRVRENNAKLELQRKDSVSGTPQLIALTIEVLNEDDFLVSQPAAGAAKLLVNRRTYTLGIFGVEGRLTGETTCLGRTQYVDARKKVVYTYRFSIPKELNLQEQCPTSLPGRRFKEELKAELSAFELKSPINGIVLNLGKCNAKFLCYNALNKLQVGQDVYLKVKLPQPVGQVTEMVRITGLTPCPKSRELTVAVTYLKRIKGLNEYLAGDGKKHIDRKAG